MCVCVCVCVSVYAVQWQPVSGLIIGVFCLFVFLFVSFVLFFLFFFCTSASRDLLQALRAQSANIKALCAPCCKSTVCFGLT